MIQPILHIFSAQMCPMDKCVKWIYVAYLYEFVYKVMKYTRFIPHSTFTKHYPSTKFQLGKEKDNLYFH